MAKVEVLVCDHCGTMEDVRHIEVFWESERQGDVDLCVEGRKPLEALLALRNQPAKGTTPTPVRKAAGARRGTRSRVTTLDEIEKMKAK